MNGNAAAQPSQPQQVMMKFNCITCQGEMVAPRPVLRVFNASDITSVAFVHNRVHRCPSCGSAYVCLVHPQGLDQEGKLMFVWQQVQTQDSAIVPGNQQTMQQAIQSSDLEKKIKTN